MPSKEFLEFANLLEAVPKTVLQPALNSVVREYVRLNYSDYDDLDSALSDFFWEVEKTVGITRRKYRRGGEHSTSSKHVLDNWKKSRGDQRFALSVYYWFQKHCEARYFAEKVDLVVCGNQTLIQKYGNTVLSSLNLVSEFTDQPELKPTRPNHHFIEPKADSETNDKRDVPHFVCIDLPMWYQERPSLFDALKGAVLAENPGKTFLVHGPGGFGKTTLVSALCMDPEVRQSFPHGVLWLQFNPEPGSTARAVIASNIGFLDPRLNDIAFTDDTKAVTALKTAVGEKKVLLVLDDVWREEQLRPFSSPGQNCVCVATTRNRSLVIDETTSLAVDEMVQGEAEGLLRYGVDTPKTKINKSLSELAHRLGRWPLLLELTNGWIRRKQRYNNSIADIITVLLEYFDAEGITLLDSQPFSNEQNDERNSAVRSCIETSLDLLPDAMANCFRQLGVFPEDTDIPLEVVADLWKQTAGMSDAKSNLAILEFAELSLLKNLEEGHGTVRLHDVTRSYLRTSLGKQGIAETNEALVLALRKAHDPEVVGKDIRATYYWQHILFHLVEAGRTSEAIHLATDFDWLDSKLNILGAQELQRSFSVLPASYDVRSINRAVTLSLSVLSAHPESFALQMYGRLGNNRTQTLARFTSKALANPKCWPRPIRPHLLPIGAELMRFETLDSEWIVSAVFSSDETKVLAASHDGTARIWDVQTGEQKMRFEGHTNWVGCAEYSADESRVLTASFDGTARLWNTESGEEIYCFPSDEGPVTSACFSADDQLIATASRDCLLRVWDSQTGLMVQRFEGHEEAVTGCIFSHSDEQILTRSHDGTARLWQLYSGVEVARFTTDGSVESASISPDEKCVLTTDTIGTVQLWDVASGDEVGKFSTSPHLANSAAFSRDGRSILTASRSGGVHIWDVSSGDVVQQFHVPGHWAWTAEYSADETQVLAVYSDRSIRLWNIENGKELNCFRGHPEHIYTAHLSPSGRKIVSASMDGTARLWDAETKRVEQRGPSHNRWVRRVHLFDNEKRLISISSDDSARIWSVETGDEVRRFHDPAGIHDADTSATSKQLAIATERHKAVYVYSTTTGKRIRTLLDSEDSVWEDSWQYGRKAAKKFSDGREYPIEWTCYSPKRNFLATASSDRSIRLWDSSLGRLVHRLNGHRGKITDLRFSGDGRELLSASSDRTARLWNTETGSQRHCFRGHKDSVKRAVFFPEMERIATVANDKTMRIWDRESGREVQCFSFHFRLSGISILPYSGLALVSYSTGGEGGGALLNIEDGARRVLEFSGYINISRDGQFILESARNGTIQLWDVEKCSLRTTLHLDSWPSALSMSGDILSIGDSLGSVHFFRL